MERKRFLAVVMTVMMVISMIPSMVFAAAPSGELGGKLKIKGLAAVGVVLSADYARLHRKSLRMKISLFPGQDRPGRRS